MKARIIDAPTAERVLKARRKPVRSAEIEATVTAGFGTFVPSAELLAHAIEAVFWASLSSEEGRPVLVRILFSNGT